MNHQKNLVNFIDELISYKAKFNGETYSLDIDDLDDDEQSQLSALKLEECDRDTSECVHGLDFSIDNDYSCALLKMLQTNTQESRDDFARIVNRNVIAYFKYSLQGLIDYQCSVYLHSKMSDSGYCGHIDRENGDLVWRKSA
jgi:hypothetical protein